MARKTLEVGKTYAHSRSGVTSSWRIVEQWGPDLFEGIFYTYNEKDTDIRIMFDRNGKPVGAKGKSNYKPDNWHLVVQPQYEIMILHFQDEPYKPAPSWLKLHSKTQVIGIDANFLVREKGNNMTVMLYNRFTLSNFLKEIFD